MLQGRNDNWGEVMPTPAAHLARPNAKAGAATTDRTAPDMPVAAMRSTR
jgi:hypothetical protein